MVPHLRSLQPGLPGAWSNLYWASPGRLEEGAQEVGEAAEVAEFVEREAVAEGGDLRLLQQREVEYLILMSGQGDEGEVVKY
jgi:hypothetical protein